jgi:hypothetical protein
MDTTKINFGEWIDMKIRQPELTYFDDFLDAGDDAKNEKNYVASNGMNQSDIVFVCVERDGKRYATLGEYTYGIAMGWSFAENDFTDYEELVPTHWMPVPDDLLSKLISVEDNVFPKCTEKSDGYDDTESEEDNYLEWESERVLVGCRQYYGGGGDTKREANDYLRVGRYQKTYSWIIGEDSMDNHNSDSDNYRQTVIGWMPLPEVSLL